MEASYINAVQDHKEIVIGKKNRKVAGYAMQQRKSIGSG